MNEKDLRKPAVYLVGSTVSWGFGAFSTILCLNSGMSNEEAAGIATAVSYGSGYGSFIPSYMYAYRNDHRNKDGTINMGELASCAIKEALTYVVLDAIASVLVRAQLENKLLSLKTGETQSSVIADASSDAFVYAVSSMKRRVDAGIEALASANSMKLSELSHPNSVKMNVWDDFNLAGYNYTPPCRDLVAPWHMRQKVPQYKPSKQVV